MNRLTERNQNGEVFVMPDLYATPSSTLSVALNRLAAYEDTGLTPEEIGTIKAKQEIHAGWVHDGEGFVICTRCKSKSNEPFAMFYNFCPDCGAAMDGNNDEKQGGF